jgi:hypothetical protein
VLPIELSAQPSIETERQQGIALRNRWEGRQAERSRVGRDQLEVHARRDVRPAGVREHIFHEPVSPVAVDRTARAPQPAVVDQECVAALDRAMQRVDEGERADRRDPIPVGVGRREEFGLRRGQHLDEVLAIQSDPNLALPSEDPEREVVEQLVREDHIDGRGELGPDLDPLDRRESRSRSRAPFDRGVGDRELAGPGEHAPGERPIAGSHLGET